MGVAITTTAPTTVAPMAGEAPAGGPPPGKGADLPTRGRALKELINKIQAKVEEQQGLLRVLEWQATVMEHGVDPAEIVGMTAPRAGKVEATLKDGTRHEIPVPPSGRK